MQHAFRIGEAFHVEPSLNRVTGPGGSSRLEPKVMRVLVCLADHAGQMVPKARLLQSAWPDTAVGDDVLTRAISELRRLFEDDPKQPRVIETIPKSGYRLIAPVLLSAEGEMAPATLPASGTPRAANLLPGPEIRAARPRRGYGRAVVVGVAGIAVVALATGWLLRAFRTPPQPAMRVVPLTALSGSEYGGAFSPDGRQVAFAWNGEVSDGGTRPWWQGNWDIYIKAIGSSEVRRLTTDPGVDLAPQWSPDGRQIAYARSEPPYHSQTVRVVSSLGGSDRKISDFPIWLPAVWSPDGRYLVAGGRAIPSNTTSVANGIYLIPVQGGEPRAVTRARPSGQDQSAVFSADGHRLAYVACPGPGPESECHLQVLNVDARFAATGSPRRLTGPPFPGGDSGVSWTPDGRFVIFNAQSYLWRVEVDSGAAPERIEQAGFDAFWPYTSPTGDRLAFTRKSHDEDIYRFEPGRPAQPVAPSSLFDGMPQFSPDGRRIAFCSSRSGDAMEVWVANADGSSPQQLTHGPSRFQCGPSWSPDGRRIAFESQAADGHPHVWTVDREGGTPRQITSDAGDQMTPTWSRDGEWIYFSWSQPTGRDIWRVRVSNGSKERVTHGGGFIASESVDGATLLYLSKAVDSPLMAQPLAGGAPRQVIACVAGTAFAVHPSGIYYLPCSGTSSTVDPNPPVHVRNPVTGEDRILGRLEEFEYGSLPSGFAVSPDGQSVLYGRLVRDESDLMLLEGFR